MGFSITCKRGMFKLNAYSDDNWNNNPDNAKKQLSYIVMVRNGLVSRTVRTQALTAKSTVYATPTVEALSVRGDAIRQNMFAKPGFKEAPSSDCVPFHIGSTSVTHIAGNNA